MLEVRGRLRSVRRKHETGMSVSRLGALPGRVLRHAITVAALATALVVFLTAAGVIGGYAVSGFNFRTQVRPFSYSWLVQHSCLGLF